MVARSFEESKKTVNYLSKQDVNDILAEVEMVSIRAVSDISQFTFDSKIKEYNDFLYTARVFDEMNISKTFLLIHKKTKELLAYMTLSADSIKLTKDEKDLHSLTKVPYAAVPALKVGKLAVNKEVSENAKRKGYGSFLLNIACAYAIDMNEMGVACRFITVDADIEYNENTPQFYIKNGFVENLSNKSRNPRRTISMRKDIAC